VDVGTAIGSIFAAVGLSGAAGLNAYLPLLISAVLDRMDVVELGEPFGALSGNTGIAILTALFLADFAGDKVPGLDHALHIAGTVIAPVSGALLFVGQTGIDTQMPAAVAVILGAVTAETVHGGRAALRPASTAATAGIGNPVLSLGEDATSLLLTIVAFALPVLAFTAVIALIVALVSGGRRLAARRGAGGGRPPGRGPGQ